MTVQNTLQNVFRGVFEGYDELPEKVVAVMQNDNLYKSYLKIPAEKNDRF